MELTKTRYKQTEVGLIPVDWEVKSLETISLEMVQGVNTAIDIPEYVESGIPMLKANDVIDGNVDLDKCDFVSHKTYSGYTERFKIKKYDFLFSNIGARLGTGALFLHEEDSTYAWNVMRIRPKIDFVFPKYFSFGINSPIFFKQIQASLTGSGMGFVPKNILKNLKIPLPPTLEEQKAIATALSDVDALITQLETLIAKKKAIKQGAMQELLTGKTRLSGFENDMGYKQTEVGMIPVDWEVNSLNSIIDNTRTIRYGIVQPGKFDPNGKYLIRGQDYSFGWANPNRFFRVSPQIEIPYKNARVKSGDLIITIVGASTGHIEIIPEWLDGANLTQTTARLAIDKNKGYNLFYKYYLKSKGGQEQVANYIKGAAQPGLNCGDIEKFLITIPSSLEEQKAIGLILTEIDKEIQLLEGKKSKYESIKQGMMQELLTGKTRLV